MNEPILVVDPGTAWTTAAVATDGRSELLKEPSSGSYCWPTSVALDGETLRVGTVAERRKRSDPLLYAGRLTAGLRPDRQVQLGHRGYPARDLLSALLGVLRTEAERLAGLPVARVLLLTGDAGGSLAPAAQELIAAAAGAGFTDAELLFLPAAVAMAAADQDGPPDASAAAERVLVCDAGASALRLTLVRAGAGQAGTPLASATVPACGGDMLDGLLTESMSRGRSTKWVRPLIAAPGAPGERAKLDLAELARRIRHELTDADQAEDTMTPLTPVVRFSRQDLEKMMRPPLGQLSSACREMLGKAGSLAGTRVMLVGGCARTPAIQRALGSVLGRPVPPAPAPELAALHGGIVWAEHAATRRVAAVPVPVGLHGLAWPVPGDAARLIGYALAPGAAYEPGEPLARVRTDDDAIWDLAGDEPGILDQYCASPDAIVATADVLAVGRRTSAGPADRRARPLWLGDLTGDLCAAFGPDGRQCATADASGMVRIWDAETAAELARFQARTPQHPGCLAAAMTAEGHWLVAYFDGGAVILQDVTAGRQTARVAKGSDLRMVQFSGDGRYLCTAEGKRTRIWEASGREVMSVKERLLSDGGVAMSRDGRRLAVVSRTAIEVWDQPGRQHVIIRKLPQSRGTVRHLAFSADATKLLLAYDSELELMSAHDGQMLWSATLPVPVRSAEFAPDDSMIATVSLPSGAAPVSLRDPATGTETGQAGSADGPYGWARFSPDGRFLIAAAADHAALWALAY